MYEDIEVEVEAGVATVTLSRPEKLNAISPTMRDEIEDYLGRARSDNDVRVIRLRGAGRGFCSGYDLSSGESVYSTGGAGDQESDQSVPLAQMPPSEVVSDRERLRSSIERWLAMWNYRKPIVAQVHGYCLAGGLDLIGVCDFVVASRGSKFGHPAGRGLGIPPTMGMLPMKIGLAQTKRLFFTGDVVDGDRAHAVGIVDELVDDDDLEQHTLDLCRRMALMPADALTLHKHVINRWAEVMNLRLAALEGAEFDALFHVTPASKQFGRIAAADGLSAALDWRDGPYR